MIKFEYPEVYGFSPAIRGMRNPLESWAKSDSEPGEVGEADLALMRKLFHSGTDHRKFMRMIAVYVDITAPLYWWKEFDTYKVGTVANSCSTMHKIHARDLTMNDFSTEHLNHDAKNLLFDVIRALNIYRKKFLVERQKDKISWYNMIQLLPTSYNQRRTVMLNYEVLANIRKSRLNHKLDEWREFCKWAEGLPYFLDIVGD